MFKKKVLAGLLSASICSAAFAATPFEMFPLPQGDGWNNPYYIFSKYQGDDGKYHGWRIPAITRTAQGTLVTVADYRIGDGDVPNRVWYGIRVSEDNGSTWSDVNFLRPNLDKYGDTDWRTYVSDPQLVSNPETGSTFLFGYQADTGIGSSPDNSDFLVFKSTDGGKTWDKGTSLKHVLSGTGYNVIFQGPGNGMYYNDKLYVSIQQWGKPTATSGSGGAPSTSGIMYSEDDGKTWKSSLLINDSNLFNNGSAVFHDGTQVSETSESSVFHHKGYVYLAAKTENRNDAKRRIVFRTKDDGKTWERVNEDFLPNNMAICQTSSYAISENIYLVGYSVNYRNDGPQTTRIENYLTTNTGRKILISQNPVPNGDISGYSSITADQDNLYVFAEGAANWANGGPTDFKYDHDGSMLFRRFDISAKEYANINGQLLKSAQDQFYLQNQMSQNQSYISGSYGDGLVGFEGVLVLDKVRLGAFYKEDNNLSEDVYRTIAYDLKTTSLLAGYQGFAFDTDFIKDHAYAGYQYSEARYVNSSETDSHALVFGYGLNLKTDYFDYEFAFNGRKGDHDFNRNRNEGLGKHASFGSYTFGFKNEFSKSFEIIPSYLTVKPFAGIENIYFKHEAFTESYANGFNEFTIDENSAWSHELYAGAKLNGAFNVMPNVDFFYEGNVKLATQLADQDKWIDTFVVLDDRFSFARPVEEQNGMLVSGELKVGLDVYKQLRLSLAASRDSFEENRIVASVKYSF